MTTDRTPTTAELIKQLRELVAQRRATTGPGTRDMKYSMGEHLDLIAIRAADRLEAAALVIEAARAALEVSRSSMPLPHEGAAALFAHYAIQQALDRIAEWEGQE